MEREIYDSITYENGCVRVIYEDNHIVAVEKPQGILSQSDVSEADDLLSEIKKDIAARYNKPGEVFVGLVHRLDRNTGGTMIFAKTSKGASRLSEQLRNKKMHKGYFVLVDGKVKIEKGTVLRDRLEKDETENVVRPSKNGKDCLLYAEKIAENDKYTLCFAVPITGRTHQIRAQFALRGWHLVGDVKYGGKQAKDNFLGLWSGIILVKHPTKDVQLCLASTPKWDAFPEDIYRNKIKEISETDDFEDLWKNLI